MIAASLVLVLGVAAQPAPTDDPIALVERLGAMRYAEREAAAKSLEKLGVAAMPALRSGRDSRDLEIRTRAAALLQKIEGSLLTRPTMVTLDFDDVPLADVVQALSKRSGMKIALFPQDFPRWRTDRVSLHEDHPVTFWRAVERLCAAAALQDDIEPRGLASRGEPALTLTNRGGRPVYPVSEQGPFRVYLTGLDYQRHVGFAAAAPAIPQPPRGRLDQGRIPAPGREPPIPRPTPITTSQCFMQLRVVAEPRLGLRQAGPPRLTDAHDEQGQSLTIEGPAAVTAGAGVAGYFGGPCNPVLHLRAPLSRPAAPGASIQVLRGLIPLRVVSRQPDPLVVQLASAVGKSFEKGDVHLTVHEVRNDPNRRQRQIEISIRENRPGAIRGSEEAVFSSIPQRFDDHQRNIEIIDARGQPLPWFQSVHDPRLPRLTLTIAGTAGAEPKELRYYRLTETGMELPFAFSDILMP